MAQEFYSIKEAASILGISETTIRRYIKIKILKATRFIKNGNWKIRKEEIERFKKKK